MNSELPIGHCSACWGKGFASVFGATPENNTLHTYDRPCRKCKGTGRVAIPSPETTEAPEVATPDQFMLERLQWLFLHIEAATERDMDDAIQVIRSQEARIKQLEKDNAKLLGFTTMLASGTPGEAILRAKYLAQETLSSLS